MGSILNFILPKNEHIFEGPITNYIYSNYNFTNDYSILKNHKNILLIEGREGHKSFSRMLDDELISYISESDILVLVCCVADPGEEGWYFKVHNHTKAIGIENKIKYIDTNVSLSRYENIHTFHFFVEEAVNSKNNFFDNSMNDLGYVSKEIKESEIDSFRNKKFLSFSRNNDKQHRLSLLHDYLTNDFSESYFSFLQKVVPYCSIYHGKENQLSANDYNKNLPIELDTNGNINDFRTHNTFDKKLFLDSVIHIVSETSFEVNELFISEKVLKPILNFQPFILIGPYLYLSELKRLGFKTFSDFWDESYDEIENPKDRYMKIRELILELNSKSIEELNLLYKNVKDICIYNNRKFNSLSTENSIDKIFNKL